jgi:peptidoglycan/LPS O-acetylase OafA/YrhL
MATTGRKSFYIPELDGLRFLAFLLVFIHNALPVLSDTYLEAISAYGWVGVDLFFCLSAFLITKLLVIENERRGGINIRNFYARRALRIWPLYFFYIGLASAIVVAGEGWSTGLLKHIAGLSTFTFNFVYFLLLPSPLLLFVHLWTISYEEQFYAIIPWFLRKLLPLRVRSKWIVLGFILLMGTLLRAVFIYLRFEHPAIYILPFTHFEAVLGGVAMGLGLLDRPLRHIGGLSLVIPGVLCLAMIFLLPNNDVTGWGLMLTYPLVGVGMSLIVFSTIREAIPFFTGIIRNGIFVYLGRISYGLYVYHLGSLGLASRICNDFLGITIQQPEIFRPVSLALGMALTIVFSILSYHSIERPFLKSKDRFSLVRSRPV